MIDLDNYPYASRRVPVFAKECVATSQPLAAMAGVEVLAAGGNAIDAAIATAITLTVVEPVSNSIGSDAFALVWDGKTLHSINGSGQSPAAITPAHFAGQPAMPAHGWDTVTVPGAVATWVALSERFGRLPFERLFERAIHYAKNGFHITPTISGLWKEAAEKYKIYPEFCATFLPGGKAPNAGELFYNKAQAQTLSQIRDSRGKAFYEGMLAAQIAQQSRAQNGLLRETDLANFKIRWDNPISARYRQIEIFEVPPNNGGLTTLIALAILNQFNMTQFALDSIECIHLQIEAMKLAFMDSQRYIGDPRFMQVSPEELLAPARIEALAASIDLKRAQQLTSPLLAQKGTVYLTTADKDGLQVSFIQSHYETFGSGIVIKDTGIGLQNRGAGFNLIPGHANEVGPSKYPYHTIMPSFVLLDGKPLMSFGVMGGHMQPQGQLQVLSRIIDYGQNPQTALDAPRWHVSPQFEVYLEPQFSSTHVAQLKKMGHAAQTHSHTPLFGGGQIIYNLEHGFLAASDPRKDGLALGR